MCIICAGLPPDTEPEGHADKDDTAQGWQDDPENKVCYSEDEIDCWEDDVEYCDASGIDFDDHVQTFRKVMSRLLVSDQSPWWQAFIHPFSLRAIPCIPSVKSPVRAKCI